mgnify:CR=1 FL=1
MNPSGNECLAQLQRNLVVGDHACWELAEENESVDAYLALIFNSLNALASRKSETTRLGFPSRAKLLITKLRKSSVIWPENKGD